MENEIMLDERQKNKLLKTIDGVEQDSEHRVGRKLAKLFHVEVTFDNGYEKHQVIPECDVPKGVLSDNEMEVLEHIYEKFADFGSVEISKYSHKEKGYSSTKQGEIISYAYAKDIRLD